MIVEQNAPLIRFDRAEPFLPQAVGWTVFATDAQSPSSKFFISLGEDVAQVIEYAIWWDWDIQHLYELEHVWVHLDAAGAVVQVEASAHGNRLDMGLPLENGRVVVYSEPGKHAFAPGADWLVNIAEMTRSACGEHAGSGDVLTSNPFQHTFTEITPLDHRLARRYLQRQRFQPTFDFSRVVDLRDVPMMAWPELAASIPGRVYDWTRRLKTTVPHIHTVCLDSGDTLIDEGTEIKDENGVTQRAEFIPGAPELLRQLVDQGYRLALVADGPRSTFENTLGVLFHLFSSHAISSDVGVSKPDSRMFRAALDLDDYSRVVMVGNNLERDIKGANRMGIISVWLNWSPRRSKIPADREEIPDYTIRQPLELLSLLERIELEMS
jgi:HAD superfamily hydrolase (TIGR01549 family)